MNTKQIIQEQIFTTAYRQYKRDLNYYALSKIGDNATSQDLVQNTFLKAWNYVVKGGEIAKMRAFLFRILNHLIIDEYRKRKPESLEKLLDKKEIQEPRTSYHESIPEVFEWKAASSLIARLPEKFRQVMNMRYMNELTIEEISLATGQSKNTIAVQAYRGRRKLRLLYRKSYKQEFIQT